MRERECCVKAVVRKGTSDACRLVEMCGIRENVGNACYWRSDWLDNNDGVR